MVLQSPCSKPILLSVESTIISCTGSLGHHKSRPIFSEKIANVQHLHSNQDTCVVPNKFYRTILAAIVKLSG